MDILWIVVGGGLVAGALIVGIYCASIYVAYKSIFPESGRPISMSQALLSSLHMAGQILFGILAIVILAGLISVNTITSESGLPILSAIIAYLLGKGYRDIGFNPSKSSQKNHMEQE